MLDRRRFLLAAAAAAPLASHLGAQEPAEAAFAPLFNGQNLTGWQGDPLLWLVEDGELVGRSPGIGYNDFLATEARYSDFVLKFQIRLVDDIGNSGVQFRSERVVGSMEMIGYQADVGPTWWGSLYDESRRRVTLAKADEELIGRILKKNDWNDYEVRAQGPRITLTINGQVTADYTEEDDGIARDGHIAVQVHAGPPLEVRFRNLRIREL